jgi:hypothetical protein
MQDVSTLPLNLDDRRRGGVSLRGVERPKGKGSGSKVTVWMSCKAGHHNDCPCSYLDASKLSSRCACMCHEVGNTPAGLRHS